MIDFAGYSYPEHKAAIVCTHVLNGAPVLAFCHESDDDIQFMCGANGHQLDEGRVVGLVHLLEHIRAMTDIPAVEPGFTAERRDAGAPWSINPIVE